MIYQLFQVDFHEKKGFYFFISNWIIIDQNERQTITNAMNQLMYDVGTPVPGQEGRQLCVYFRPAQASDREVLKIQYGNGCSASVSYKNEKRKFEKKSSISFRLDILQIV